MRGFSGLSDFFLRKAFKFALKRNLGKYLASELDLNQLDVQLGQGTIELRQLLLNCNELNEQVVSQMLSPYPSVISFLCVLQHPHAANFMLSSFISQQLRADGDVLTELPALPLLTTGILKQTTRLACCRTLHTGR